MEEKSTASRGKNSCQKKKAMVCYINVCIAADAVFRNSETSLRFGFESYVVEGKLAVRAGGREEAYSFGFGFEHEFQNGTIIVFDYALEIPTQVQETLVYHFQRKSDGKEIQGFTSEIRRIIKTAPVQQTDLNGC